MDVRDRVGDSVGVQNGQNFPSGAEGACGESGAFGAHGLLRPVPLATNYWPEAPYGGGVGPPAAYYPVNHRWGCHPLPRTHCRLLLTHKQSNNATLFISHLACEGTTPLKWRCKEAT